MSELVQINLSRQEILAIQENLQSAYISFMPIDGRCYSCGVDLVTKYPKKCISEMITGCPACNRSFCD